MMTKQKWILGAIGVFIVSVAMNVFFIKQLYFTVPNVGPIVKPIPNPVQIIQVNTISHVIPIPSVRPSGTAEAVLAGLEKVTPILTTDPMLIYQDASGKFYFPQTLTGSLEVGYLKYKVSSDITTKVTYNRKLFPLKAGFLELPFVAGSSSVLDVNLMVPITIPYWNQEICFGAGFQSLSITHGWTLYQDSQFVLGVAKAYNSGIIGLTAGISFNL